jgi:hypothetical protein
MQFKGFFLTHHQSHKMVSRKGSKEVPRVHREGLDGTISAGRPKALEAIWRRQSGFILPPLMGWEGDGVAICAVARREGSSRLAVWQKAALTSPPIPSNASAEGLGEDSVSKEHFDAGARPLVDIVKRLEGRAPLRVRNHSA